MNGAQGPRCAVYTIGVAPKGGTVQANRADAIREIRPLTKRVISTRKREIDRGETEYRKTSAESGAEEI